MLNSSPLPIADPEIYAAIAAELVRQQTHIELIASENFTYPNYDVAAPAHRGACAHIVEHNAARGAKQVPRSQIGDCFDRAA